MKRYSFGTFLVDASNQEAFDLCTRVAALRPVPALPLVLLAPSEGGKTHLLYSIANRIRSTHAGTTLGFVRAEAFPAEVRDLVEHPEPIEQASRAIFLVDDAEEFIEHVDALEAVVRLFLEHDHAVVVASKVAPEYLVNLTPGLREILAGGLQVRMGSFRTQAVAAHARGQVLDDSWAGLSAAPPASIAAPSHPDRDLAPNETEKLRARVRELATELEHVRAELALRRATEEDVERYRNAVEELKTRYQEAQRTIASLANGGAKVPTAPERAETLDAELSAARQALVKTEARYKKLQRAALQLQDELKRKADLEAELDYMRRELAVHAQAQQAHADLQKTHATLYDELTRLKTQYETASRERDQALSALSEQQAAADRHQSEIDAERRRKDELLARMRMLLEHVEQRREQMREDDESQGRLLDEVEQLASARMPLIVHGHGNPHLPAPLEHLLENAKRDASHAWDARRVELEHAVQTAHDRAQESAAECMRLQAAMEQQAAQVRDMQQTVSGLTAEKKKLSAQLESVRHEMEAARRRYEDERQRLQADLEHAESEHQELITMLDEQRVELDMTRMSLEVRKQEQSDREQSRSQLIAERDSARAALEAARAEHDRVRTQHKTTHRRLETALAELDALRHEAASQVAAANAQAGELERRLAAAHEQYHHSKHAGQSVAQDLRDLEHRFLETAELVNRMSQKLTSAADADSGEAESAYLYALTRSDSPQPDQLSLDMPAREAALDTGDVGGRGSAIPYDGEKFIPFKPAEHKINRTI